MGIQEIKDNLFATKVQVIQIDSAGKILESEGSIFPVSKYKFVTELHPFFEGISPLFEVPSEPTQFPCVNLNIDSKQVIADVDLMHKDGDVFVLLYDFTDHYVSSRTTVQERNETSILKNRLVFEKELLLAKEDIKNKFLAHLNHELRNPLNNILGFLEVLDNSKLDYEQKETLNVIRKTGKHLKILLDDLIDISKIENGIVEVKNIPFSLSQVMSNLERHFQLKYEKSKVLLDSNLSKDVEYKLIGDPTRLNQIFFNLVDNAFKNTEEGSVSINVKCHEQGNQEQPTKLVFTVSDTGRGIPKEEIDTVFDSYHQLAFDKIKPIGQGLGLKIVKDLVALLNGTIKIESVLNEGTTFEIMLPFKVRENKKHQKKSIPKGSGIVLSKKILVIENEEIPQMLMMKTFLNNDSGYYIEIARDGVHAIQLLEKKIYSLILLKVQLPDMDAYQILDHIRNTTAVPISTTPVLVVSGNNAKEEQEAILSAGASGFLSKPYTKKELFSKINKVLSV